MPVSSTMREPCGNALDNHCFARLADLSIINTQIQWTIHRGILFLRRLSRSLIMLTVSNAPEISRDSIVATFFPEAQTVEYAQ
jgi:hypothetical protein